MIGGKAQSANNMHYDVAINFQMEGLFWDKNTLEWMVRSLGLRFVLKQDVAEGRGFEPKVNVFEICVKLWRRGEKTNATHAITDGGLGAGHQAAGGYGKFFKNFCNFLEKIAILMPFGSHFARFRAI